jgi:hypothetical protein
MGSPTNEDCGRRTPGLTISSRNGRVGRLSLDAGMFASFPGGFIDKRVVRGMQGGNANTTFTMGPGEFVPLDVGGLPDIRRPTGRH